MPRQCQYFHLVRYQCMYKYPAVQYLALSSYRMLLNIVTSCIQPGHSGRVVLHYGQLSHVVLDDGTLNAISSQSKFYLF